MTLPGPAEAPPAGLEGPATPRLAQEGGETAEQTTRGSRLPQRLAGAARWMRATYGTSAENVAAFLAGRNPSLWMIAMLLGAAIGAAAVAFRIGIGLVQYLWTGTDTEFVIEAIGRQPWWLVFLAPVAGGLVVGLLNEFVLTGKRAGGVADVIEASARAGQGLGRRNGLWSALATVVSLGSGASAGREGPVIHLGATLVSIMTRLAGLPPAAARILLACGVASAVSASFLFAHEVILRHTAISAFVPIVIASVSGTLAARLLFVGDMAAFQIPAYAIGSYWEMPAFALLGVVAAGVAIVFQFTLIVLDQSARAVVIPAIARPVIGGAFIGALGLVLPEVLGVGYQATDNALHGRYGLGLLLVLMVAKIVATAVTLASRFGGGIFSPALYLGAMTGCAFGIIASAVFPELASDKGLYAILGMGAVAAALLGAPISTTVIVFELTGGYALSIALLLSVSIATGLHLAVHGRSYFHYQLETRGVVLAEGPHRYFLKTVTVASFMTTHESPADLDGASDARTVRPGDTLEAALRVFNETGADALAVTDPRDPAKAVGTVSHVQALRAYNRRLEEMSVEEHR